MMWIGFLCAWKCSQNVLLWWMTFSTRSAGNPFLICCLPSWKRRSCLRRWELISTFVPKIIGKYQFSANAKDQFLREAFSFLFTFLLTVSFPPPLHQKESEKRNVTIQPDDPISFMQLTAKNEMSSKEDQFQLSLLAAMGNTQRKEAADPLASKLNKVI